MIIFVNSKEHRDKIAKEYGEDNLKIDKTTTNFLIFHVEGVDDIRIFMNKNLFTDNIEGDIRA